MQGQGRTWLLQREAAAGLRTVHLTDKHFRAILEVRGQFVQTGSCLIRLLHAPRLYIVSSAPCTSTP